MREGEMIYRPCGTVAAYQRHRYHGEVPCDLCKEAKKMYNRYRYRHRHEERPMPVIRISSRQKLNSSHEGKGW
jgi:hypothetical protein